MRMKIPASMTLVLVMSAATAGAQFEYTPPGGPNEQPASRKEALEKEVQRARYRLGPFRVAPWATVRDVAYVRSLFSTGEPPPTDLTATAGLGFRAYLRNGPKVTWGLEVLPEYVWWQKQEERRRVNGRYQLGFHGFFNRLTVEAFGGRQQQLKIVTPEVPVLVSSRTDGGEILAELELTAALFPFVSASLSQLDNLVDGQDPRLLDLDRLDREERVTRAGIRWQPRVEWSISLGVEDSRVDFSGTSVERSNQGTSPMAQVRFHGRRLGFEAEVAARSLEAREGSEFVPYDRVTGGAALRFGTGRRLGGSIYTSRNLVYALSRGYAYLQDDRLGGSIQIALSDRIRSRAFVETGTNDYTAFAPDAPERHDDVSSVGAAIEFSLGREVFLGLQALRSEFDSGLPGGDRTYSAAGLTVTVGDR